LNTFCSKPEPLRLALTWLSQNWNPIGPFLKMLSSRYLFLERKKDAVGFSFLAN
jgi:hypothetical protein